MTPNNRTWPAGTRAVRALLVGCALLLAASPAAAVDLSVSFSNLSDPNPGDDLWRARVSISGDAFTAVGQGASLTFPAAFGFEQLQLVGTEQAGGWHAVVLPAAPEIPVDNAFEVFAQTAAPASRIVDVEFVWTGFGTPSLVNGSTSAPLPPSGAPVCVPEPSPEMLGLAALAVLALLRRRRPLLSAVALTALVGVLLPVAARAELVPLTERTTNVATVGNLEIAYTATHIDRVSPGEFDISFHLQVTNEGASEPAVGVSATSSSPSAQVQTAIVNVGETGPGATAIGDRPFVVRVDRRVAFDAATQLSWSVGAPGPEPAGEVFAYTVDAYPLDLRFTSCAPAPDNMVEFRFSVSVTNNQPVTRSFVLETSSGHGADDVMTPVLSFAEVAAAAAAAAYEGELTAIGPPAAFNVENLAFSLHTDPLTHLYVANAARLIDETCALCHTTGGIAQFTPLVYEPGDAIGNLAVLQDYADANPAAGTTLLRKPQGLDSHGGGALLDPNSPEFAAWQEFVDQLTGGTSTADYLLGVELSTEAETLRKAAIVLAGRGATATEIAVVDNAAPENREAALRAMIRGLLVGPGFNSFLREGANDRLLTQKIRFDSLNSLIRGDRYYPAAYDRAGSDSERVEGAYDATKKGLVEEPLALIVHVIENERPYTEILTADYVMMNPYSDVVYQGGLTFNDPDDPDEWRPGQINGLVAIQTPGLNPGTCTNPDFNENRNCRVLREHFPAGLLSSTAFLNRYPTTPTNRNRARSRWTYDFFLGIDIENTASRLELDDLTDASNPTLNNRACAVCHERLDPVAGAFQDHFDRGIYRAAVGGFDSLDSAHKRCFTRNDMSEFCVALRAECASDPYERGDTWYCDMRDPGFIRSGDATATPYDPASGLSSLQWLAQEATSDPRFATAAVRFWFRPVYGRDPLTEPPIPTDPDYASRLAAWQWESEEIQRIGGLFATNVSGLGAHNARDLFVEMMMSPLFRANRLSPADPSRDTELAALGMGRLLSPEQLERKLTALIGNNWGLFPPEYPQSQLTGRFPLVYGGIDSDGVTERTYEMTSLMQTVADTMANEVACPATVGDFAKPAANRLLFPEVEPEVTPTAVAHWQQNLTSHWQGTSPAPATEELSINVGLQPGNYRALVLAPNSFCDFSGGQCTDQRWVIADRIEVTGPTGATVALLEAEDADTDPDGILSADHGFDSTFVFGSVGRLISMGGYVGVDFTVTDAGSHRIDASVWGFQGGVSPPRAVLLVEQPGNTNSTFGANAIRRNLAHLHWRLAGEREDPEGPVISASYQLFLDLFTARVSQVRAPFFYNDDEVCRLEDFRFQGDLDANSADPTHAIRSWQAILTALLGDYRFLHE